MKTTSQRTVGALGVALCALAVIAAQAWAGVITYKDGRVETVPTILSQDGDAVWVIRSDHQTVKILKKDIATVATVEDLRDAYEKKSAALKLDDAPGHLKLAQWCFDQLLDGAAKRELRLAVAGDAPTVRAALRLAMAKGDTASARAAIARLRALNAADAWLEQVSGTVQALGQIEARENAAKTAQARETAAIGKATAEIAALTQAINNPYQTVTHEERTPCPRCWGTGRVTTVANSLPQNVDQQHLLSVHSIGDGAYDTYTVPMVITTICPQCQGRRYIVTATRAQERIDTAGQARRRDETQKTLDDATAARARATAELAELAAKRKELTAELLTEAAAAPALN